MKNKFLFRLFAIAIFCTASLAIKSETGACKCTCAFGSQKIAVLPPSIMHSDKTDPINHDGFFTKI